MSKPEYQSVSPETYPFSRRMEIRLLARTLSPLPIEDFNPQEWTDLNSATVIAGEAAKTCYSSNLLTPLDYVTKSEKHRASVRDVSALTRASGHHSTREHIHYLFGIKNLSRKTIYALHSHSHYASDQESQRYVTMSQEGLILPLTGNEKADELLKTATDRLFAGYRQLTDLLIPHVRQLYLSRFPQKKADRWRPQVDSETIKRTQEVGRYLLPLSMGANLYHSINGLTLIRLAKMIPSPASDPELHYLIKALVDSISAVDPSIREEIGTSTINSPSVNSQLSIINSHYAAADEFDSFIGNAPAHLDANSGDINHRLAQAIRFTLNASSQSLPDSAAINLVLNPQHNPLLASVNGEMVIDQLSQTLNQICLSASVALSHAADSQLQRHRGFHHTRPLQLPIPRLEQDIIIPALVRLVPEALDLYLHLQSENIVSLNQLANLGCDNNTLSYLCTNATKIRKRINGPFGAFHHFFRLRTCLNAQEEIYNLAVSLVRQLPNLSPLIASNFDRPAPCGVRTRAGVTPICPEGNHYCGIPIWKKTIADYPTRDI